MMRKCGLKGKQRGSTTKYSGFDEKIDQVLLEPEIDLLPEGEVKEQLVKSRIGQYFFRIAVLNPVLQDQRFQNYQQQTI